MPFDPDWERVHQQVPWGTKIDHDFHRFLCSNYYDGRERSTTTFLDLGCGAGANAVPLAGDGFSVVAVDGSMSAIGRMNARVADQQLTLKGYVADITALQVDLCTIDCCVDICTLQQMPIKDARKVALDALMWLKPGGVFFSKMVRAPFALWLNRTSYIRMATLESIAEIFGGYASVKIEPVSHMLDKVTPPEPLHHFVIEARKTTGRHIWAA